MLRCENKDLTSEWLQTWRKLKTSGLFRSRKWCSLFFHFPPSWNEIFTKFSCRFTAHLGQGPPDDDEPQKAVLAFLGGFILDIKGRKQLLLQWLETFWRPVSLSEMKFVETEACVNWLNLWESFCCDTKVGLWSLMLLDENQVGGNHWFPCLTYACWGNNYCSHGERESQLLKYSLSAILLFKM